MRCCFRRVHRAGGHPQKAPAGVRAEAYAALRFRTLCEMRAERGVIAAPCYRRFRNDSDFAVAGFAMTVISPLPVLQAYLLCPSVFAMTVLLLSPDTWRSLCHCEAAWPPWQSIASSVFSECFEKLSVKALISVRVFLFF